MTPAILSMPFRPFFFLAAAYGVFSMLSWALLFTQGIALPVISPPNMLSHGHALVSGFAGAIIAGFLLTAAGNWTSRPTTNPLTLSLVLLLWLAGRAGDLWPTNQIWPGLVFDGAFWLCLTILLLRVILTTANWRNLGFALLPLAFGVVDVAWHLGMAPENPLSAHSRQALLAGVDLLTLIMAAMGGRVIPFFTGRRIQDAQIRGFKSVALIANSCLLAVVFCNLWLPGSTASAVLMGAAAVLLLARLAGWDSFKCKKEPMLWILHLGYLWLAVGLALRAGSVFCDAISSATALHATTAGALGCLGLGMLARVALGHTGRTIQSSPTLTMAFVLINLGAIARLLPLVGLNASIAVSASALCWIVAWGIYLVKFTPILFRPRPDAGQS